MPGGLLNEVLSFAPGDATLLALSAALPTLLVLYAHCSLRARRLRPDLSLGKLETIELDRAELLYEKVSRRREEIYRQCEPAGSGWRAWYQGRAELRKKFGAELEELDAYARDLRSTIMRLRGRPIQRYKSWIHVISSQSALARALGCYCLVLALLIASYYAEPLLWAPGTKASFDTLVLWQAVEGRMLLANWMAASFVAVAMPPLYLVRRVQLYRWNEQQIRKLREFAAADPDQWLEQRQGGEEAAEEAPPVAPEMAGDSSWFDVLGVSPSATIEDVRQAYKVLVKQNHPDRVHNMSPVFRELAEAETKKLNQAYAEALTYLRQDDLISQEATCAV